MEQVEIELSLPVTPNELAVLVSVLGIGASVLPEAPRGVSPKEIMRAALSLHDRAEALLRTFVRSRQAPPAPPAGLVATPPAAEPPPAPAPAPEAAPAAPAG